jgi:uncharacterized protein (DUF362 family)
MKTSKVAIVHYEKPVESVQKVVNLAAGLENLSRGAKVFIKPNIVFWCKVAQFPKWGVITTSRVIHDIVLMLKEKGIDDITIGEGTVVYDSKDTETAAHAFETLGYQVLAKRYGVKVFNVFERPFEKVDFGDEVQLNLNTDLLDSDFVISVPVLKTHVQTVVSLGIKNLKGLLDVNSRKKCHSPSQERDLHFMISKLADTLPVGLAVLDGIFTNEHGPGFDGRMRRTNILVASTDVFAADKVGAGILGYETSEVPHLVHVAKLSGRPSDLSDVEVVGERLEDVSIKLEYAFPYNESGTLPLPMERMGIKGVSYPKYDLTLCTYCSMLTGVIVASIASAWRGQAWDNVEVLTGKIMKPDPAKKSILIGKCLYEANKNHPRIGDMLTVKTCPPSPKAVIQALHKAGIQISPDVLLNLKAAPASFLKRYKGKPEFDESFFRVE